MKYYKKCYNYIVNELYLKMDFKNNKEFEFQYLLHSIVRGILLNWVIFFVSIYSFCLDIYLSRDSSIDITYRSNLLRLHIVIFLLSIIFIIIYTLLKKSNVRKYSRTIKTIILIDMLISITTGSLLSLNSQRYTGNINAYMLIIIAASMVIPLYPRWVIGLYCLNHVFFVIGLSYACKDSSVLAKQLDSTTAVIASIVLFLILYRNNVKNFLNDEMLKADKINFIKLVEINPFPLLISRIDDGKIIYTNHKALLFYDIQKDREEALYLKQLYVNSSDLNIIYDLIKSNESVVDFVTEQRTLSGDMKYTMVNYVLIDYFSEKCILSGITDIAEINQVKKDLTVHARIDELTGVLNRRIGMEILKKKFESSINKNEDFTVCFMDIDDLKIVNDKYGHVEGDALIVDVCEVINNEIKQNDIIFRYGGDEFVILFNDLSENDVNAIRNKIGNKLSELSLAKKKPYKYNVSIGVFTHKPEMKLSIDELIEKVDMNMYGIKLKKKQL